MFKKILLHGIIISISIFFLALSGNAGERYRPGKSKASNYPDIISLSDKADSHTKDSEQGLVRGASKANKTSNVEKLEEDISNYESKYKDKKKEQEEDNETGEEDSPDEERGEGTYGDKGPPR